MEPKEYINNDYEYGVEVDLIFKEVIKRAEVVEALILLDSLPFDLVYHSKDHTLDVIRETILFAVADNANRETIEQQVIAAAWHDVGYTQQSKDHESIGVELFKKSEAYKKLSQKQKTLIESSILSTRIELKNNEPYLTNNECEFCYLSDADVSNFGRKDFFKTGEAVAKELGIDMNDKTAKKNFMEFTLKLLQNHSWKTYSAKKLRQRQKELNIAKLRELINEI